MEPLTFKIVTDADDSGVKKYESSLGGLNTTSQKAGAALRMFSREALEAKSGADLAAAGATALSQAMQKSLLATATIGGAKILSDQFKAMAELLRGVANETKKVIDGLQKMGDPQNMQDALKAVGMLDSSLASVTEKLASIKSGNWFTQIVGGVTGATAELEAQIATLTRLRDAQLALGVETERKNAVAMMGASEEEKALAGLDAAYAKQIAIINTISDEKLRQAALSSAEDTATIARMERAQKVYTDSQKNMVAARNERAKLEVEADLAAIKAKHDAIAIEADFEAKRQEAHNKELQRSAERIDALKKEIEEIKARSEAISASAAIAGGELAFGALSRGVGQRPSSAEVGAERARKRGEDRAQMENRAEAEDEARRRIEERGGKVDKHAIQRELTKMIEEGAYEEARARAKAFKDLIKQLTETTKAEKEKTAELKKAEDAQAELSAASDKTAASFDGVDFSVNRLKPSLDMVSASFIPLGERVVMAAGSVEGLGSSARASLLNIDGLGAAAESSNLWLSAFSDGLADAGVGLADFTKKLTGNLELGILNTKSIILTK